MVLAVCMAFASSGLQAQSSWRTFGHVGEWRVAGTANQCQSGYAMRSGIDQFSIGLAADGTYMSVQDLSWMLRPNRRNMMRITIELDGSRLFRTEALVIGMVGMIQVFPRITDMPEDEFWTKVLGAESMYIDGRFPAFAAGNTPPTIDLQGLAETLPLLRQCAEELLPDVALPF